MHWPKLATLRECCSLMLLSCFSISTASKIPTVSCQIPHHNQSYGYKNDGIQDILSFYWYFHICKIQKIDNSL